MVNENEITKNEALAAVNDGEKFPFLPQEFFTELMALPPCKLNGECTNCGKCG